MKKNLIDKIRVGVVCFMTLITQTVMAQNTVAASDEFDDPASLANWKRFYQDEGWSDMMKKIEILNGYLLIQPWTSGWYADYHAPFVYKDVEGDFSIETKILVSGIDGKCPKATWSLSGLMVRESRDIKPKQWKPNEENWIFITTGIANNLDQPVFETKTTVNSVSSLKLYPNKMEWVQLKIIRRGSVFTLLYKYDDDVNWTTIEEFQRLDLSNTLQVGINAYTDYYGAGSELMNDLKKYNSTTVKYGNPDLQVLIDYVRFDK